MDLKNKESRSFGRFLILYCFMEEFVNFLACLLNLELRWPTVLRINDAKTK